MNIANVSSTSPYPPQATAGAAPTRRADHDGDADDGAGAVGSAASAQSEAAESGKLNVTA